jgi:hypothetical protein
MKRLLLGYDAQSKPISLEPEDSRIHSHFIGASGSGKSKLVESKVRQYLRHRQGFCLVDPHGQLYEDVRAFAAHEALDRELILLNLSRPGDSIIGFNPFRRAPNGDVSVQVDRRVTATVHAWGVKDTDQTPTLARVLRLVYTVMLEQNLGLPQVQHLIDFNAREIRGQLVDRLASPLVQREWRELQQLKAKDWRDETLSAKNRLFKFLTSETLCRFMGLPDRTIDLLQVMDEGKGVLVNLAPSDYFSHENARAFGALLVNEFFENALRRERDEFGRSPLPYHLLLDEFQEFVSVDIADMLDQVRKFSLFLTLIHQRFRQLDEGIIDAVLTNCRIKAVFGGLPVESAKLMAQELFIRELDAKKIKMAIYQTKFWPEYRRDKTYARGTSHSTSHGTTESSASASSSGLASGQSFYTGNDWFSLPVPIGTSEVRSSGVTSTTGRGFSDADATTTSESEVDIPIFFPVPFEELSSVQYYSLEEQLTELTAALKEQFPRHCFIKIHGQQTQPMLVPFVQDVRSFRDSAENLHWYRDWQMRRHQALSVAEVDRLLGEQETALLQATATGRGGDSDEGLGDQASTNGSLPVPIRRTLKRKPEDSVWNRRGNHGKSISADQWRLAVGEHDE